MTRWNVHRRRLLPFGVAMGVAVGVAVAAFAGSHLGRAQLDDPNDVRGPLDVRRVWFDPEAGPPQWTIVKFSPWTPGSTLDRGSAFIFLDTKKGAHPDYYVLIRSNGHTLLGSLWRDLGKVGDVRLGSISIGSASNDLSVDVQIPLGQLEFGALRTSYRWSVVTMFTGRVCRATCIDLIPDHGAIEQPIGTPTPTPTMSPTPTASRGLG